MLIAESGVRQLQPEQSVALGSGSGDNCNGEGFCLVSDSSSDSGSTSGCPGGRPEPNGNEELPTLEVLISLNSGVDSEEDEEDENRRTKEQDSETEDDENDDNESSSAESTSCSENSFEMSSTTSFASTLNKADQSTSNLAESTKPPPPNCLKVNTHHPHHPLPPRPTYSQSMDSFLVVKPLSPQAKEQISQELDKLDTGLPELDFKSLEEKLSTAAKEHEESERRKLGDEVRRRLALQYDQFTAGPSPAINTRPNRSNLAHRLNVSKNLQVCYMNELAEDDEESDDEFNFAPFNSFVPKSKSTPNLSGRRNLNASELARRKQPDAVGFHDRLTILREETQLMLQQAKKAAKLQMEVEKQQIEMSEKISAKRFSRLQLSKMKLDQLKNVLQEIKTKINEANSELVTLLMEKDSLYMEQDSMLVDIEDTIQHTINSETLDLPPFLYICDTEAKDTPTSAPPTSRSQQNTVPKSPSKSSMTSFGTGIFSTTRWKIFKQ